MNTSSSNVGTTGMDPMWLEKPLLERMNDRKDDSALVFLKFCRQMKELSRLPEVEGQYMIMRAQMDEFCLNLLSFFERTSGKLPNHNFCVELIAGGMSEEDFLAEIRKYDYSALCGYIWLFGHVAYRCRTCQINPSMSICASCFHNGDHKNHDFNMFRSQTGGACDCGDKTVMRSEGFCSHHGDGILASATKPPEILIYAAEQLIPYIIWRLLICYRDYSYVLSGMADIEHDDFSSIIMLLQMYSEAGEPLKRIIAECLLDEKLYKKFCTDLTTSTHNYLVQMTGHYDKAVDYMKPIYSFHEVEHYDCQDLYGLLEHRNMMEELVFWLVKHHFPQSLTNFLLSLLPNADFKIAFAETYAKHYPHLAKILSQESNPDVVANRVVHISVQILSNNELACFLVDKCSFLRLVMFSLSSMVRYCLVASSIQSSASEVHLVVDCRAPIMEKHSYWAVALDLHSLLGHKDLALMMLRDPVVLDLWITMALFFQGTVVNRFGMNPNHRMLDKHVDFEVRTYSAAFTAEVDVFSNTLWKILHHLTSEDSFDCILMVLQAVSGALQDWFRNMYYGSYPWQLPQLELCFHYPLHRIYIAFLQRGLRLGVELVLPSESFLRMLMLHPLRIQVGRCEITSGMWVRNGASIRHQFYLYCQSHFCASFIDWDLYLMQLCMQKCNPEWFVLTVFDCFHTASWFSFSPSALSPYLRPDWIAAQVDSALQLIATLYVWIVNLVSNDEEILRLEVMALLSSGEYTYSHITDHLPDRGSISEFTTLFERTLNELADYKQPMFDRSGQMTQGTYVMKDWVWEKLYDPLYVMSRTSSLKDFRNSFNLFSQYAARTRNLSTSESSALWIPLRFPKKTLPPNDSIWRVLHSRSLHSIIYTILHRAVYLTACIPDFTLSLCIFFLELAIRNPPEESTIQKSSVGTSVLDLQYCSWFPSNSIELNLSHRIFHVICSDDFVQILQRQDDRRESVISFYDLIHLWETDSPLAGEDSTNSTFSNAARDASDGQQLSSSIPFIDSSVHGNVYTDAEEFRAKMIAMLHPTVQTRLFSQLTGNERTVQNGAEMSSTNDGRISVSSGEQPTDGMQFCRSIELLSYGCSSGERTEDEEEDDEEEFEFEEYEEEEEEGEYEEEEDERDEQAIEELLRRIQQFQRIRIMQRQQQQQQEQEQEQQEQEQQREQEEQEGVDEIDGQQWINFISFFIFLCKFEENKFFFLFRYSSSKEKKSSHGMITAMSFDGHSILSLLVVLHFRMMKEKLKNGKITRPLFYQYPTERPSDEDEEPPIGDGVYFIERILDRAYFINQSCRDEIHRICEQIAKQAAEILQASAPPEDRKQLEAKRKQEILAKFQEKQGNIMKDLMMKHAELMEDDVDQKDKEEKPYTCLVCNQHCEPSVQDPICLLLHMQATNVMSKQVLSSEVKSRTDMAHISANRGELTLQFREKIAEKIRLKSTVNAFNNILERGVFIQSCGHCMHENCHAKYLDALKSDQNNVNSSSLHLNDNEILCPLCRRVCNAIAPIVEFSSKELCRKERSFEESVADIEMLLSTRASPPCGLSTCEKFMGELCKRGSIPQEYVSILPGREFRNFVLIAARITTELNSTLRCSPNAIFPHCNEIIMRVLALVSWYMAKGHLQEYTLQWWQLSGCSAMSSFHEMLGKRKMPILLQDAYVLLMRYVLYMFPRTEAMKSCFHTICRVVWNLLITQILLSELLAAPDEEYQSFPEVKSGIRMKEFSPTCNNIRGLLSCLVSRIGELRDLPMSNSIYKNVNGCVRLDDVDGVVKLVQAKALPYLRYAAFLMCTVCKLPLPDNDQFEDFYFLKRFCLNLSEADQEMVIFWRSTFVAETLYRQLEHLINYFKCNNIDGELIVMSVPRVWLLPKLIDLPDSYQILFEKYHFAVCDLCQTHSEDSLLCLLCNEFLCFRNPCCRRIRDLSEAEVHSFECNAGTGVFLNIEESSVIITRYKRYAEWGFLYLDSHGEEDRGLKRGKPLKLCRDRLALLQEQWLTHGFDYFIKQWFWITRNPNVYTVQQHRNIE
ncbi:E3 ubiquitin-protein ligase UBR3 [Trichinella sp. T9]|nr:E3 ubiquitin-protein ligase UBR3 [Trichinella sp. T9]KRX55046.1 E3 ubiquitin-protein ligase UBR3 [Trichinella sp. T9]